MVLLAAQHWLVGSDKYRLQHSQMNIIACSCHDGEKGRKVVSIWQCGHCLHVYTSDEQWSEKLCWKPNSVWWRNTKRKTSSDGWAFSRLFCFRHRKQHIDPKCSTHILETIVTIKGAVSRYSVIFCAFFARAKNGGCSRKCRGHQTWSWKLGRRAAWQPGHLRWLLTWQCSEPTTSRARVALLHLSTATAAGSTFVFRLRGPSKVISPSSWIKGSRLAATAISVSILCCRVWFCAPSEACFGDLVAESMGDSDWEKESAVWSSLSLQ